MFGSSSSTSTHTENNTAIEEDIYGKNAMKGEYAMKGEMIDNPVEEPSSMIEDVDNKESSSMFSSLMSPLSNKESPVSPVSLIEEVKNETPIVPDVVPEAPAAELDVPVSVSPAPPAVVASPVPVVPK